MKDRPLPPSERRVFPPSSWEILVPVFPYPDSACFSIYSFPAGNRFRHHAHRRLGKPEGIAFFGLIIPRPFLPRFQHSNGEESVSAKALGATGTAVSEEGGDSRSPASERPAGNPPGGGPQSQSWSSRAGFLGPGGPASVPGAVSAPPPPPAPSASTQLRVWGAWRSPSTLTTSDHTENWTTPRPGQTAPPTRERAQEEPREPPAPCSAPQAPGGPGRLVCPRKSWGLPGA